MFADYECEHCGKVETYRKPYGEEWPKALSLVCCKGKKKCSYLRLYGAAVISVAEGSMGNAANGYTNTFTYTPSTMTPSNKVHRTRKIGGALSENY